MRAVKSQDYSKISDDLKEIEVVTKMRKLWPLIEVDVKNLVKAFKDAKKPHQDLKSIINEKLNRGNYKNELYANVLPRYLDGPKP